MAKRIDELPVIGTVEDDHYLPAMRAGNTGRLSVSQIVNKALTSIRDGVSASLDTLVELAAAKADVGISFTGAPGEIEGGGTLAANRVFGLVDTAVSPGEYTNPTVTVDQKGRVTDIANGDATGGVDELLARTSLGTSTTYAVTGLPTTYKRFIVIIDGMSHNSGSDKTPYIELSDDNGSSWTSQFKIGPGLSSASTLHGLTTIDQVAIASVGKVVIGMHGANAAGRSIYGHTTEVIDAVNAIRVGYASGDIDGGFITILGVK